MKPILLSFLLASGSIFASEGIEESGLLRFPATNGDDVVFSYAGDLYIAPLSGGTARRLTSHQGYEIFPRFSPDKSSIAFTGQYDGNTEVYIMPAEGGEPRRLTFTSTNERDDLGDRMGPNNIALTWSPDGKKIVYRNRIDDGFTGKLWTVSPEGGMPELIPLPEGGFCSYSPDGKRLAYNRVMREFRNWKYYRGGMADDIWIYDPEKGSVENITNNVAQDIFPMWIGDTIYFISDRDRTMNLFAYNTRSKQTTKVTNHEEYDIKFPSTDGKIIVYENGGKIYKFDPEKGKPEKVSIKVISDNVAARKEKMNVEDMLSSYSLSPDAHRLAMTARGEVFDVPATEGVTKNISRTPGANERNADWSPDGKHIAYISDDSGETEVWIYSIDNGEKKQLTSDNDTYIRTLRWSPDCKKILYTDRKNRIVEVDAGAGSKRVLQQNPEGEFYHVDYSPDSKWITYTKSGANNMSVVYVYDIAAGKEYAVTEKWYDSSSPIFSTDSKYLIFNSDRDFNPIYSQTEWNHAYNRMGGLYMALLQSGTPSPLLPKDDSDKVDTKDEKAKSSDKGNEDNATKIDVDGIQSRLIKLPLQAGYYRPIYSDGKNVWYANSGAVKAFNLADKEEKTVVAGASMAVAPGGKKAAFYKNGKIYIAPLSTSANLDKPVNTSDLIADVDYEQEWAQIFDEVWRAFRDGFYLENMHGVDWNLIKEKYARLLPYAKTRYDLNYIIGEMIAELACGHAYVNPGQIKSAPRISMGLLGAELSRGENGYYRIDKIIPGAVYSETLRSPLTEPGLNVNEGDYITAIDGIATNSTDNIYSLLIGKAGKLTELTVSPKADGKSARKVIVKPIDNEAPLYHYNWVQNNIKKVEKATNGRVGYIYIPDMGPDGLNEFARYFYPQLDKEALIIDDRANGGGNVSPMLIERLLREPYRLTMSRTSTKVGTIPDATLVGPKVLLVNKYSASDGDLFPWSFKANKMGKIIGTRTWGGIIGISGSLPYMDGTDVRVPFFTNYDAKTGEWIVENHGVDPDILIDNDPVKEADGIDQQLDKAIEVIMAELKNRKPLPPVPAPRTFKDLGVE